MPKSRCRHLAGFVLAVRLSLFCEVWFILPVVLKTTKKSLTCINLFLRICVLCDIVHAVVKSVPERWRVASRSVCEAEVGFVFVSVSVQVFCCLFLSEPSCLFSCKAKTAVAVHYREKGDCGCLEFNRVCLRPRPLLNEELSILLIMLLWLMSLSAESGKCSKTLFLFGLFACFNWAE